MKKIIFPAILIASLFLAQIVSGMTGFGPAEIFTSNQRGSLVIGKATLINGDDVPKYGVFSIIMPYSNRNTFQVVPSEIIHARVVCNECGEEMQRHEAIKDYKYGDSLHGICTSCGSSDLIFYDEMPRDEYNCLSLEGAENFKLEKIGNGYRTAEMIIPGGACSVNLLFDASESYLIENYEKHWEVHLRGTTQENKEECGFMTGGVDLRILVSFKFPLFLDVISNVEKGKKFTVKVVYGNADRTWEIIPELVKVTFNGITKTVNQEGITSFVFPETRGDYEYKIEAKSDHYYLPVTEMLKAGMVFSGNDDSIFENIYFLIIAIIATVIIAVIVVILFIRRDSGYILKR